MTEKRIEKKNTYIDLKYDESKYEIEHATNHIILKRIKDNKIINVFTDNLGFIVEYDEGNKSHFIMTDYSNYLKDRNNSVILKHYIDYGEDELVLKNEINCMDSLLESIHVKDNIYLTGNRESGEALYNLKYLSKDFNHIYKNDKIYEILGNIVLVDEIIRLSYRNDITDTITYGINEETFEVVTPIYSNLQDRFIYIYTNKEIEEKANQLIKEGRILNRDAKASDITIALEIKHYLEMLSNYLPQKNKIYNNLSINESFVRKFVK